MKKVFFSMLIALFVFGMTAEAQNNGGSQQRQGANREKMTPQKRAEQMAKQLDLTAQQTQKVQKLFEEQDAKRKERTSDSSVSREDRRSAMEKERKDFDEKLEKIIGKEKMEKYKKARTERMQSRQRSAQQGTR